MGSIPRSTTSRSWKKRGSISASRGSLDPWIRSISSSRNRSRKRSRRRRRRRRRSSGGETRCSSGSGSGARRMVRRSFSSTASGRAERAIGRTTAGRLPAPCTELGRWDRGRRLGAGRVRGPWRGLGRRLGRAIWRFLTSA